MIEKCYYLKSTSLDPYWNLAVEEYLLNHIPDDSMILFLWQNDRTVVIGRNQNAYKECHLREMEQDRCYLARRKSGGGAVYHDRGNLNFSLLMYLDSYDIAGQLQTVTDALCALGLPAEHNGRNDIEIDGFKVSGNAYLTINEKCLHHGTLLYDVDMYMMERYLNPSDRKIKARGFDSVKARVKNLKEFKPELTLEQLQEALMDQFANKYGKLIRMEMPSIPAELVDQYRSYSFIYGQLRDYTVIIHDVYAFGETQLYADIENTYVQKTDIFSDSDDAELVEKMNRLFEGLHVDDESYRLRYDEIFAGEYEEDMRKIYEEIKRYCL